MKVGSNALDQAVQHLGGEVDRCHGTGQNTLPSLVELARACRVSHVTMLKAVRRLQAEGRLYTRRGSGIFVAGGTEAPHETVGTPLVRRWQAVAARLEQDLAEGELDRGETLPGSKELAERYSVSLPTLHRALRSLAGRSLLERRGRRLVPSRLHPAGATSSVLLAVRGRPLQVVSPREPRYEGYLADIDRVFSKAGVMVRRVFCEYTTPAEMTIMPPLEESWDQAGTCLGIALVLRGQNSATVERIVSFAARRRRPVAVLDDTGAFGSLVPARSWPGLRVFTLATSGICGETTGRFLLQLGHRRMLYVAPQGPPSWSAQRLRGLEAGFRTAGVSTEVRIVDIAPMPSGWESRVARTADSLGRRVLGDAGPAARSRQTEAPSAIRDVLLRASLGQWLDSAVAEAVLPAIGSATAVVGASDDLALACLAALRDAGRRVPQELSVVGFDDTPEAAASDLTSFNFDSHAAAQAMLNHILQPGPRAPRIARPVEIRGFVNRRGSVGPARQ